MLLLRLGRSCFGWLLALGADWKTIGGNKQGEGVSLKL